jgi:hypothetical protein
MAATSRRNRRKQSFRPRETVSRSAFHFRTLPSIPRKWSKRRFEPTLATAQLMLNWPREEKLDLAVSLKKVLGEILEVHVA